MNVRWTSLVAFLLLIAILPAAPAKAVTLRMPYEGPAVGQYGGLADCEDATRSMGMLCLDVPRSASTLDLLVLDQTGLDVGGVYYLHAADGALIDAQLFCAGATLPLPSEAQTLVVRLDALNGPAACLDSGALATGPATEGVVALRLR